MTTKQSNITIQLAKRSQIFYYDKTIMRELES